MTSVLHSAPRRLMAAVQENGGVVSRKTQWAERKDLLVLTHGSHPTCGMKPSPPTHRFPWLASASPKCSLGSFVSHSRKGSNTNEKDQEKA